MGFVNGQEYQHALVDLQATATGAPYQFTRFKAIDYKVGAKKEAVRDSKGKQISYTIGDEETDGNVSMLLSQWFDFRAWLRVQALAISAQLGRPIGIGQVAFDFTCAYGATLATLQKDELFGAMVQEEPRKSSDDQKVLVVDIPLFILGISDKDGNSFVQY